MNYNFYSCHWEQEQLLDWRNTEDPSLLILLSRSFHSHQCFPYRHAFSSSHLKTSKGAPSDRSLESSICVTFSSPLFILHSLVTSMWPVELIFQLVWQPLTKSCIDVILTLNWVAIYSASKFSDKSLEWENSLVFSWVTFYGHDAILCHLKYARRDINTHIWWNFNYLNCWTRSKIPSKCIIQWFNVQC